MKLGMSQACYRWVTYSNIRRDRPAYLSEGYPLPYMQTVVPPATDADVLGWVIDKSAELGLEVLYVTASWLKDREGARTFKDTMAENAIHYVGGISLNVAAEEAEWQAGEFERVAEQIRLVGWGGGAVAAAVHSQAIQHNHFTQDPPVEAQIERAIRNFGSLVPVCEEHQVVLAFENHMDYRLSEVVQVIKGVDSQWIGINLDTANPIGVIEDPFEGAQLAARYAVNAHLKDMRIQPATGTGEPRVYWAPLGQGDVPIAEILALLQAEAPNPADLPVCVEVAPPPDHDPDLWMHRSLDWLRQTCGQYFENR